MENAKPLQQTFQSRQGCVVVRLVGYFLDRFGMNDFAVAVEDEDTSGQQFQLFDQHAPILSKSAILIVAAGSHIADAFSAAKTTLGERQIEADRDRVNRIAQFGQILIEAFGLDGANGRVQRRHDTENARFALQVGRRNGVQSVRVIVKSEIGRLLPDLHFLAG